MRIEEALTAFLEERERLDVPGNALIVRHGNDELYRHFSGTARPDTLFRIFSMTKVVTVTAALQLYERGLYDMDDPVGDYLPEYARPTVWDDRRQAAVPALNTLRIRDLFCMSSGLPYGGDGFETARQVAAKAAELEAKHPGQGYSTLSLVRSLGSVPLAFEPGTHWMYGMSHDVLGGLIEVLSGLTLGEYMRKHIFEPLGMHDTFFRCPEGQEHRLADFPTGGAPLVSYGPQARYEAGGGGLLSTADDYMKLASALTAGGISRQGVRILSRKMVDLMRMDQLDETQKKDFNWGYLKGYSYGLGVRTLVDPAKAGIPGSVGEFGWCGVLGTWVMMDPAERLTAVYMHQRTPNLEAYVQRHLRPMIYALV